MKTFTPRMDVLPETQQRLWPSLASVTRLGFVLYGGTAIALRLGHRASVDFDFFSEQPLNTRDLMKAAPFMETARTLQEGSGTLTVLVPDAWEPDATVKVSYFGEIDFGRVSSPEITEDGVLQVASLPDLMATKLKVMLQRAEAKDYKDVAAILRAGVSLDYGLASARALFGNAFQHSESLKALVWFADGDVDQLGAEDRAVLTDAVEHVGSLTEIETVSTSLGLQ